MQSCDEIVVDRAIALDHAVERVNIRGRVKIGVR